MTQEECLSVILSVQTSVDMEKAAMEVQLPSPTILLQDTAAVLVVERQILCSVPVKEAPLALLAAYYTFNMEYPKGIRKCLTTLKILVLDVVPSKIDPKISAVLSALTHIASYM